ncbi:hypothetical protein IQ269_10335 [Tychonema sp. LEGE 07199]|nr:MULTISPECIES: hypothetical protein [unclassified Tychonema]MBE9121206.1 hypothetical protein [Tychonema sp. LEGE 07199]MBE9133515.1 hypothetical protein [Tychonema sp. LEGE 07196]
MVISYWLLVLSLRAFRPTSSGRRQKAEGRRQKAEGRRKKEQAKNN